ncbi:MAG: ferric iron uptake transcriptional regulator [Aquabacterium sp.]|uniref:ferric iron uptake transcriptional regulator n=1 Tax=Aquabacterium sp. TaxID=1872578 RepID=UPI0025BD3931|nr:ferric iron uptake transcriptional regulator [Aquabacterium sp.]MBI5926010.1 ferric iron uptake transcriptional regulator [Aquabacterium sp.]
MTNAEELKSSGLKATLPRIKILEVFQQAVQRHMTAEDVYKVLLTEGSDIGLATVYRVLMQFEQAGILSRNHFEAGSEAGKAVFELNEGKHHDHLVCVNCGRVEEFYDAEIERRQQEIARERGYKLQDHALALYVICEREGCSGKASVNGR